MVEYQKVIQEYKRMCDYYYDGSMCEECPMAQLQINAMTNYNCEELLFELPELAEDQIMKWSREHSPLVYPFARDVINMMAGKMKYDLRNGNIYEFMDMRLNKATADYFGIKPINEDILKSKI